MSPSVRPSVRTSETSFPDDNSNSFAGISTKLYTHITWVNILVKFVYGHSSSLNMRIMADLMTLTLLSFLTPIFKLEPSNLGHV